MLALLSLKQQHKEKQGTSRSLYSKLFLKVSLRSHFIQLIKKKKQQQQKSNNEKDLIQADPTLDLEGVNYRFSAPRIKLGGL